MRVLLSAVYDQSSPFDCIVDKRINVLHPNDITKKSEDSRALILWGGEDISPSIYGHTPARQTSAGIELGLRDKLELALSKRCLELGIPIIGICRGAQLMCALSGGTLIQHVTGHAGMGHDMITNEGTKIFTNSIHHQMMNPFRVDHFEMLAWVPEKISKVYIGNGNDAVPEALTEAFKEPEVVWFPGTKSLCIQGHPEFSSAGSDFIRYCLRLTKERIYLPQESNAS